MRFLKGMVTDHNMSCGITLISFTFDLIWASTEKLMQNSFQNGFSILAMDAPPHIMMTIPIPSQYLKT
jgi:hypothetical protein